MPSVSYLSLVEVAFGAIAFLVIYKLILSVFGRGGSGSNSWIPVILGICLILAVLVFGPSVMHLFASLPAHAAPLHMTPTPVHHVN